MGIFADPQDTENNQSQSGEVTRRRPTQDNIAKPVTAAVANQKWQDYVFDTENNTGP